MTPQEFKAWFDGFTEAIDDVPSKKQWARIKERVAEIDGKPVTERVYVDRYWPRYTPPYYQYGNVWSAIGTNSSAADLQNQIQFAAACSQSNAQHGFNGLSAMNALGQSDALTLAAQN